MLPLSSIVIDQKNSLGSTEAILVALELSIPSLSEPIYIVRNNEDITWNSHIWQSFPFSIDEISETASNEVPSIAITLANASRAMEMYISQYDIWLKQNSHQPIVATIHVLSTADLNNTSSILTMSFEISSFSSTAQAMTFNLTQKNLYIKSFPPNKITRKCHFKFGSTECGVITGGTCDKTLNDCRNHNNSFRFGGYPSVGGKLDKVYS
jgi:phage-related protein